MQWGQFLAVLVVVVGSSFVNQLLLPCLWTPKIEAVRSFNYLTNFDGLLTSELNQGFYSTPHFELFQYFKVMSSVGRISSIKHNDDKC